MRLQEPETLHAMGKVHMDGGVFRESPSHEVCTGTALVCIASARPAIS